MAMASVIEVASTINWRGHACWQLVYQITPPPNPPPVDTLVTGMASVIKIELILSFWLASLIIFLLLSPVFLKPTTIIIITTTMIIFSSFYRQGGGLHIDWTGAFVEPSPGKNNSRPPNSDVLEDYDCVTSKKMIIWSLMKSTQWWHADEDLVNVIRWKPNKGFQASLA